VNQRNRGNGTSCATERLFVHATGGLCNRGHRPHSPEDYIKLVAGRCATQSVHAVGLTKTLLQLELPLDLGRSKAGRKPNGGSGRYWRRRLKARHPCNVNHAAACWVEPTRPWAVLRFTPQERFVRDWWSVQRIMRSLVETNIARFRARCRPRNLIGEAFNHRLGRRGGMLDRHSRVSRRRSGPGASLARSPRHAGVPEGERTDPLSTAPTSTVRADVPRAASDRPPDSRQRAGRTWLWRRLAPLVWHARSRWTRGIGRILAQRSSCGGVPCTRASLAALSSRSYNSGLWQSEQRIPGYFEVCAARSRRSG
jgi:hypothetical protein